MVDYTMYGIVKPDQNVKDNIYDNHANNGTLELFEDG